MVYLNKSLQRSVSIDVRGAVASASELICKGRLNESHGEFLFLNLRHKYHDSFQENAQILENRRTLEHR